ncbi:MAG: nuclease-related domain-containing protein [bacterium]|nr:nuclease-related domain-containing protein [bacterium]
MFDGYVIFLVVLAIGVFLIERNTPYFKGKIGERFVSKKLKRLDKNYYKVLDDLLLPSDGKIVDTAQIDHIVVSNYGIFVIETKDWYGQVYGSVDKEFWSVYVRGYPKKLYNPLFQNETHKRAVEALIKPVYPNIPIKSFVALPDAIKEIKVYGAENSVGYAGEIINKIKTFNTEVISGIDRDKIVEIIRGANITGWKARRLHNKEVQAIKNRH